MFFHQVTLVFAGQVASPVYGELKLVAFGDGLFQYLDTFGVGQAYELGIDYLLQPLNQSLVYHLVEEFQVVTAVVQCPFDAVFDELLFQLHQVGQVGECHFGLYHPEFGQVARRVRVLGTERRSEGVDGSQGGGCQLAFQLSGYGQAGLLAEEVVVIDDGSVLVLLQVVQILGGHLKHLPGTFAVGGCDDGGVEVEEAFFVEELVDGNGHVVTDAVHGSKCVGSRTQVGDFAQKLHGVSFLLKRIGVVASTQYLYLAGLDFGFLSGTNRFCQYTVYAQACTGRDVFQQFFAEVGQIDHNLYIIYCRAVVQCDEVHLFATTAGTYPSLYVDHCTEVLALQQVNHFCSTNLFHKTVSLIFQIILFAIYSKDPIRKKFTSASFKKRHSPRRRPFFVRPAK